MSFSPVVLSESCCRGPRVFRRLSAASWLPLLLLSVFGAPQSAVQAIPASDSLTKVVQPDGTVLSLRPRGDEWTHWYETTDGRRVAQDPRTKAWVYVTQQNGAAVRSNQLVGRGPAPLQAAKLPPPKPSARALRLRAGAATRSVPVPTAGKRNLRRPGQLPTANVVASNGSGKIPILLTTFSDRKIGSANQPIYNASDFESMLFNTSPGALSMANLYKQMSGGKFTVSSGPSGISGWYTASKTHDYYGTDTPGSTGGGNDQNPHILVNETVQNADAAYDFGPYDTDNDGVVDVVFIVHQGADQADGGSATDIWSHRSKLTDNGLAAFQTNDVNAKGVKVKVNDYVLVPEVANPNSNSGKLASVGVFCHEYGHALGLPDEYDIDYSSRGVGNWSLMSYGANLGVSQNGDTPCYMDAWCRWELGWVVPLAYQNNAQGVGIPDAKSSNQSLYIWTNGTNNSEYFLVENRQKTGFDAALPGSGLLILHCDDSLSNGSNAENSREWWYNGTTGNTSNGHSQVMVVQSDNLFNLNQPVSGSNSNTGDGTDLFPGSTTNPVRNWDNSTLPNSRAYNVPPATGFGAATGVGVRNISNTAATMFADIIVKPDSSNPTVTITTPQNNSTQKSVLTAVGTASDDTSLREVRVALVRKSDAVWWNWSTNNWGTTTFSFTTNARPADGTANWSKTLPSLPDGTYEVHAQAVDFVDKASPWKVNLFTLDNSSPVLAFDPLKTGDSVFNFEKIGGTVSGANEVRFQIMEDNAAPTPDRFWNNSTWVNPNTDGTGPSLLASVSNGRWTPANGIVLPTRAQTRVGAYILGVFATDAAGNLTQTSIVVQRSAADTSAPLISIQSPPSPQNNQVLTSASIPGIGGAVLDPESGIDRVEFFIIKNPNGTRQFWNGSAWQATDYALRANYTPANDGWGEPLTGYTRPSGTNLPNGTYEIQAQAFNRENPQLKTTIGISFTVDFHPIYQWTGATLRDTDQTNNSDSWDTAANWNPTNGGPFGVPGADAIAVIANGDTVRAVGSRQVYRVDITSSTVNTDGLFIIKALNQTNGNINGGAVNIGSGAIWTWTGGTIAGNWGVLSGATGNFSGTTYSKVLADNTVLSNAGTINWSGNALLSNNYNAGATINNQNGAVFNVGTGDLLGLVHGYSYPKKFNNQAGAKFVHTGTSASGKVGIGIWTFVNAGTVESKGGIVEFNTRVELSPGNVFTGAGQHQLAGGELVLDGTTILDAGKFAVRGGTWSDNGNKTGTFLTKNGGRLDWLGGTMSGTLTLDTGGTMGIGDPGATGVNKVFADSAVFNNKGNVTWSGVGGIYSNNYNGGVTWNNRSGSTFTATTNAAFAQIHGYSYTKSFNNESGSTFKKTGGATTGATTVGWNFNNTGLAQVTSGVLELIGGGTSSGTFSTNAGTTLRIADGTHDFNNGTKINGAGILRIVGGTVNASGNVTDASSTGGFEVAGGSLNGVGTTGATFTTKGGFTWTQGNLGGTITLAAGSIFTASGDANKVFSDGAVFNNYGQATWTGLGAIAANNYNAGAIWNNESGSVLKVADGVAFGMIHGYGYPKILNNKAGALLVKSAGTGTTNLTTWAFTNSGEISSTTGLLQFTSSLVLNAGSKFSGTGKIRLAADVTQTAPVTSTGVVSLDGGTLNGAGTATSPASYTGTLDWTNGTLAGNWTLTAGSKLNVKDLSATSITSKVMADSSVLNNYGTVEWSGAGRLLSNNYNAGAIINNESGAIFRMLNDGNPFGVVHGYGYAKLFNNKTGAKFLKSAGTGTISIESFTVNNNGEINTAAGTLNFLSRLNLNSGSTLVGAGTVRFGGDVMMDAVVTASSKVVLDDGVLYGFVGEKGETPAVYTGAGLFEWTNGTIAGALTLDATSQMDVKDRTTGATSKVFADGAVFNNKGKVTWSGQGSIMSNNYNGGITWNNIPGATFSILNDGTPFGVVHGYDYPKHFNNAKGAAILKTAGSGTATISNWTLNNLGDIVGSAGVLNFQTNLNLNDGGYISGLSKVQASAGTTTLSGNTMVNGTVFEVSGGNLVGNPNSMISGGRFDWTGGTLIGTLTTNTGSSTYIHGAASKVLADNASFTNRGNVLWYEAGNILANNYNAGSTFINAKGATFTIESPGSFGKVHGYSYPLQLRNAGTINVAQNTSAGVAKINWDYLQTADGTLNVDLRGKDAAKPEFDQALLGANATLGGTLNIRRLSTYVPMPGDTFKIMTHASRTGTFAQVLNTNINASTKLNVAYNPGDVSLVVGKKSFVISGRTFKWFHDGTKMTKVGISGVTVTLTKSGSTEVYATTVTNANGAYNFPSVKAGTYIIGAAKAGMAFMPAPTSITVPTKGITGVSPNATMPFQTFTYRVKVVDANGVGQPNVNIKLFKGTALRRELKTNANGVALFEGLSAGTFTVAPDAQPGFVFSVPNRSAGFPTIGIDMVSPNANARFVRTPSTSGSSALEASSATAAATSTVKLSVAAGSAGAGSIRLTFTNALDFDSAQDLSHFTVTVGGEAVQPEGVVVGSNSVTLLLPEGTLAAGAEYAVAVSGLKDRGGNLLANQELSGRSK